MDDAVGGFFFGVIIAAIWAAVIGVSIHDKTAYNRQTPSDYRIVCDGPNATETTWTGSDHDQKHIRIVLNEPRCMK